MILVDTCVLLDVLQDDPDWAEWSVAQLDGGTVINPIIYAELSVWYDDIDVFETVVNNFELIFRQLPRDALFLAGKAFRQYRARRGTRSGVLPDFFIGAHAAVS